MIIRRPPRHDAAPLWRLLERVGELERHSCYAYLLLCTDFKDTCLVAARGGELVGFVLAYRPPVRQNEVFVWQIGVAPEARGIGLGARLLDELAAAPACVNVQYVTATVSPDNEASRNLFRSLARRRAVQFEVGPGFPSGLFAANHEPEDFVRIGPLGSHNTLVKEETP
ncbi:MAG: diaminobutyrate acetyltransferase [Kofleriaceae bacterium]